MGSYSVSVAQSARIGDQTANLTKTIVGTDFSSHKLLLDNGETDKEIGFVIDVSQVVSLYMLCDQDIAVETNSGISPGNTVALKANEPLIWNQESYYDLPFNVDVTALFLTNASGEDATFTIEVLEDDAI